MSKKICLLTDRLSSGGAEKMVGNLSISLAKKNYDVTIVSMRDDIKYDYKGNLYNFGEVKAKNSRLKSLIKFKNYFETQNFDVILDHRVRMHWFKEFMFSNFVFKNNLVVYCVHHFKLSLYFPCSSIPFLSKRTLVKNRVFVSVSKEVRDQVKKKLNFDSQIIYNYPIFKNEEVKINNLGFDYIIAVGRLEKIKQFDVLINSYSASKLSKANIKLLIFGEGSQRYHLESLIKEKNLESSIILKGFHSNVNPFIKQAKALVMTSESEGFPMVLIEALSLKTPVVSFDCKSGPNEIIQNEVNGILVKNQDALAMTNALNKLLDNEFYKSLKAHLENNNLLFTEEKILNQWVELLDAHIA
ncbi:glycosyltransferase [Mariniflexile gromovii]|uniref:Glycosyltransferase n=1 Tax=Mariniflexile gromovii TaxID=362523 RepID=A0ABS4BSX2_9FLAO|nr:glycosyltransferase [Mariniflexile gromovii]MBP0903652.1 glycosyltransferase [Mariniflexile gromovii]